MSILVIKKGYNSGAAFRLGQRSLTIGRDPGNLIQIIDSKASRRHAMISWEKGVHVVRDLGSNNGVTLNEVRVSEARLAEGDRIGIGSAVLAVEPDQVIVVDGALARKVVDRQLTEGSTHVIQWGSETGVQGQIERGEAVDLDEASYRQALRWSGVLHEIKAAVTRGQDRPECLRRVLEAVGSALEPDRAFVLEVTPENRLEFAGCRYAAELETERRRTRLDANVLNRALRERRGVLDNGLAGGSAAPQVVASAVVVPVPSPSGRASLVLYLDSFADNPQTFLPEELGFLEKVAERLGPLSR